MNFRDDLEETFDPIAEDDAYRSKIVMALLEGEVAIDFTKADGTNRKMRATLNKNLIEQFHPLPVGDDKEGSLYVQVVFDLDKGAWRSFKWSRLISAAFNPRKVTVQ